MVSTRATRALGAIATMGLVSLIGGGRVTAVNERSATIERGHSKLTYTHVCARHSKLTYTRCLRAGVCVWEF